MLLDAQPFLSVTFVAIKSGDLLCDGTMMRRASGYRASTCGRDHRFRPPAPYRLFGCQESRGEVPCLSISIADGGFTFNSVRQRVPYDMDLVTVAVVHKANTEGSGRVNNHQSFGMTFVETPSANLSTQNGQAGGTCLKIASAELSEALLPLAFLQADLLHFLDAFAPLRLACRQDWRFQCLSFR